MEDVNPTNGLSLRAALLLAKSKPAEAKEVGEQPVRIGENQPVTVPTLPQLNPEALLNTINKTFDEKIAQAISLLSEGAAQAQKSERLLDESIRRATRLNPETMALVEAESQRKSIEIQSLQGELNKQRSAMRGMITGGKPAFWRRQGAELGSFAEEIKDLLDAAPGLADGEISPAFGKKLWVYLKSAASVLEQYADNCTAYADTEDEA